MACFTGTLQGHALQRDCEDYVKDVNREMKSTTQIVLEMLLPQESASQSVSNELSTACPCDSLDTRDTGQEWAGGFGDFDLRNRMRHAIGPDCSRS